MTVEGKGGATVRLIAAFKANIGLIAGLASGRVLASAVTIVLFATPSLAWSQSQSEQAVVEAVVDNAPEFAAGGESTHDATSAVPGSSSLQRPIEEITVRAEQTVMALRFQLRAAEDAMYARFNELNNNDEFDIDCRSVRHAGSHIPRRECEPKFFTRERQSNSIQVITQLRDGGAPSGGGLSGGAVAGGGDVGTATSLNLNAIDDYQQQDGELKAVLGKKYEAMNEEMFRIASENPDFLNALLRVEAYRKALEEARSD